MGLVSDGGVHSHNTHLYAAIEAAKERGLTRFIYTFSWTAGTLRQGAGSGM